MQVEHDQNVQRRLPDVVQALTLNREDPYTVPQARKWAVETYLSCGGEHPDEVALLVSELATNAVLHAVGRWYRVAVLTDLSLLVSDDSNHLPSRAPDHELSEHGRGLKMLALIDPDAQVFPRANGGKHVHFRVSCPLDSLAFAAFDPDQAEALA